MLYVMKQSHSAINAYSGVNLGLRFYISKWPLQ